MFALLCKGYNVRLCNGYNGIYVCTHQHILTFKVWDFETIDNADITEASTVFEMDPLVEIKVPTPSLSARPFCVQSPSHQITHTHVPYI